MRVTFRMICVLLFVMSLLLSSSGCCCIAGWGMKSAQEKRAAREDAFHEKLNSVFDKVAP